MESIDSELIELLERKAPEHLTIEEIERLSARLGQSPELQSFLIEQLQMEQYLAAALSRIDVDVDQIISGRRQTKTVPVAKNSRALMAMLVAAGVLVAVGGVLWYPLSSNQASGGRKPPVGAAEPGQEQQLTKNSATHPSRPDSNEPRTPSADKPVPFEPPQSNKPVAVVSNTPEKAKVNSEPAQEIQQVAGNAGQPGPAPRSPEKVTTAPAPKVPPWEAALKAVPLSWATAVAAQPPSGTGPLIGEEATQWLEAKGAWLKLRAPWPADMLLRLRVPLRRNCELLLWKGNEGAAFQLAGHAGWSSYHTLRDAGQTEPKLRELWETDDGLYWKFHSVEILNFRKARGKIRFDRNVHPNATTVDLFWHNGVVQLWRGDLRLASAPLSAPPDEVYLKSDEPLDHLSLARIENPQMQPRYEPTLVVDSAQPATLPWNRQAAAPATIENIAGGLKVSAPETAQPTRAWLPLPAPGICDVVFKVEGATHGTGVYLGGADGAPLAGVQLVESAWPGHNDVALQDPWTAAAPAPGAAGAPAPLWVRLLPASGVLKCWSSRDGQHWALLGSRPLPAGGPPIASLGVFVAAGAKPARALTLRHIQVRDYSGLNSLAPADLLTRAPAVASPNAQAWKATAAQSLPGGVNRAAWHRAVALRTIASGAPLDVSSWLLRALLTDAAQLPRSVEQNRRLLMEFPDVAQMVVGTLPWDGRPPQPMLIDLVAAAGEFAAAAQAEGEARPWTQLGRPVLAARLGPFPELTYEFPDALVLPELMHLAGTQKYDDLEQTARFVQLYARDNVASAVQWGLDVAAQQRGGSDTSRSSTTSGPLTIETSKAQQLFMNDLQDAVRARQWGRAAQLITHLEPAGRLEMLPDSGDPLVWVTPATEVSTLLARHPELAAQLKQSSADKGRLRVRFAIADNDLAGVMHAATQFAGTAAATEAYQWIGDQALRNSDAAGAIAWYEKAQPTADVAQRDAVAARIRLASAMLGRDAGAAARSPVKLGNRSYTAQEFEKSVQEARQRAAAIPAAASVPQVPAPAGMRVDPLAAAPADRPWLGEGLALTASGDTLLMQDARTVVAWDIGGSKVRWQRPLGDGSGGVTWQPQVDSSSVLVAARAGAGVQLQRLDLAKGDPLDKPAMIAGACFSGFAPPISGSTVFGIRDQNGKPSLTMSAVDFAVGQTVRDAPLLPLSTAAAALSGSPPLVTPGAVLVFVDGGIVCCETAGVVRWIRKQHSSGGKLAPALPTQSVMIENDAIVWQPRVPYIERIDLAHGRRKWVRMLPGIRRVIGLSDGRLIVEANERVVAIHAGDGKVLWNKQLGDLLAPAAVGGPGGVLVTRAKTVRPADPAQPKSQPLLCPELVWLDLASGQMRGVWPLDSLVGENLALGPWTLANGTIVTFFATGKTTDRGVHWDANRQLLRLVPQGPPQPPREDMKSIWDGV